MALHHAAPGEVVDLSPLGANLGEATSSAIVKSEYFEAIRLVVPAGSEIPAHSVPKPITFHCLEGNVVLGLPDAEIGLKGNDWVYLEGETVYSVRGIENSFLLMTILL